MKHIEYVVTPKVVYDCRYTLTIGNEEIALPDNYMDLVKGYTWTLYDDELAFKYYCQQHNIKKGKNKTWHDAIKNTLNCEYVEFFDHSWDNYDDRYEMGK